MQNLKYSYILHLLVIGERHYSAEWFMFYVKMQNLYYLMLTPNIINQQKYVNLRNTAIENVPKSTHTKIVSSRAT